MLMYATPTFTTEVLYLVTQLYSELTSFTAIHRLLLLVSFHNSYQSQGTPINDTDYSCHTTAVKLV